MMTSWESRLREDLHELATPPGPDSPADRALAGARKLRRKRALLAVSGTVLALVAFPVVTHLPSVPSLFGTGAGAPCEEYTTEANPPVQAPARKQPRFVREFLAKMPQRDDYYLQSATGICAFDGFRPYAYTVINLGPAREHGHLTFTLSYQVGPPTCATSTEPGFSCEDATDTTPLVTVRQDGGPDSVIVTAFYPDTRSVEIGAHQTPFDVATLRSVAIDPKLVDLLP